MEYNGNEKIIGFDLDGVILDHTANKIRLAAQYGVTLTPEETHAERMGGFFSEDIYRAIKAELYNQTDGREASPLMKGAFAGLATLREHNVPYLLISLQQNPMFAQHLIELHGLWGTYFTQENTFFAKDGNEKSLRARDLGVTHYVDDEGNILDLMQSVSTRVLFDSFDQFPDRENFVRVTNWGELTETLLKY